MKNRFALLLGGGLVLPAATARAGASGAISAGDTAWVLISASLVFLMTPGLAFFYGGLVRRKNILSLLMQCLAAAALVTVQWVMFGYSLAFGPASGGIIGGLDYAFLRGVGLDPHPVYGPTIPHLAFMLFQGMFAVITPALIAGAFAERMKFSAYCLFVLLWTTLVYDPVAHWIWGGGILARMGALDFAGGTVVHVNAGVAALVAAFVFGRRMGYPARISAPHNLPLAVLGAGLLWFGWFGFNAGSALAADGLAANAFAATHAAAAAAALAWAGLDWFFNSRPTALGLITGAVAGLVAITPAAGFVGIGGALLIGFGASAVCYPAVVFLKVKLGYDDSLDAFGVHGVGGAFGALATGVFASRAVNPAGLDGLLSGQLGLFWAQIKAVGFTAGYSFAMSLAIFKLVDLAVGLRVTDAEEKIGLDLTQHREAGYTLLD